tara:strand:- start:1385 stop:1600 length:216 start_codon:yes stop_codon:yes gene_type:complete
MTIEEVITSVLKNNVTTTYPRGVGSTFRCIKDDRISSIAGNIEKHLEDKGYTIVLTKDLEALEETALNHPE